VILLDTHALVWLASDPKRLSPAARKAISAQASALHVSAVSAWEISLLVRNGRLTLPMKPDAYVEHAIRHLALIELPVTRESAQASVALPPIHNDPFDRILIAECLLRQVSLISADRVIAKYPGLRVIW
jgi:PIN domain nuclease of toxin-antitoxin system